MYIFSSGVFRENMWRCCHLHCAKTLAVCNISVITEDIYLKLGLCVHYPKSNLFFQTRQFKTLFFFFFFFSELCPFFYLDFFLSFIKHPTAYRWHLHVVLLSNNVFSLLSGNFIILAISTDLMCKLINTLSFGTDSFRKLL